VEAYKSCEMSQSTQSTPVFSMVLKLTPHLRLVPRRRMREASYAGSKRHQHASTVPLEVLLSSGPVAKFNEDGKTKRADGKPSITWLHGSRQKPAVSWNTNVVISSLRNTHNSEQACWHSRNETPRRIVKRLALLNLLFVPPISIKTPR
jgi:hypothetical protein